jgi:hypothetical protein
MAEIAIVDYGMANLRSVQKAFERVGHAATITGDPTRVREAAKVVLPGVGAFRDAIARLRDTHLDSAITDHIRSGRPFLGICLGLQMLFSRDHEDGLHEGLGLFAGDVVRFPTVPGLKVPHMGWNTLSSPACRPTRPSTSSTPTTPIRTIAAPSRPQRTTPSPSPPPSGATTSSRRNSTRRKASPSACICCETSRGCDRRSLQIPHHHAPAIAARGQSQAVRGKRE